METKKRSASEVMEYLDGSLKKGDLIMHIGKRAKDGSSFLAFFAEVEE